MKPVIFENIEWTQKIIFTITKDWEYNDIKIEFDPKSWEQNKDSLHSVMAKYFLLWLKQNIS